MAQQKRIQLGTVRLWVRSLALLSELRIQHCRELWCSPQTWLGFGIVVAEVWAGGFSSNSPSSLGTSTCLRCGPKNKINK